MIRVIILVGLLVYVSTCAPGFGQEAFVGTPSFKGSMTITGNPIQYPDTDTPLIIGRLIEFQPGEETGWHKHPVPTYTQVINGTLTIEFEDGRWEEHHAGNGFLDAMDAWHTGKNKGTTLLKVVVVVLGVEGKKNIIRRGQ